MVKENRKRQRNRSRKRKPEVEVVPKKKRNYAWIVLIAFGMALMGAIVGQTADTKAAITLGIVGLVLGGIGGAAILLGDDMPERKGTKINFHTLVGGSDPTDVDDIVK